MKHSGEKKAPDGMMTIMTLKSFPAMRQTFSLFGAALLAGALVLSCARTTELDPGQNPQTEPAQAVSDSMSFTAVLETGTRTQLGTGNKVCWSEGDKIRVFNENNTTGVEFTLTGGEGTQTGTFSGPSNIGSGPFRAVYPASVATGAQGETISLGIPSSQAYAAGSFGNGANISAGQGDQLDGMVFRNLMGVLSLTLKGNATIGSICILSYVQETLFGTATVSGIAEAAGPTLTFDADQTDESFSRLTLDCGEGVALTAEGKTFNLVVPAGTLKDGYLIEVYDQAGKAMVRYAKADDGNAMERNVVVTMPALTYAPDYKATFLQSEAIGAFSGTSSDGEMNEICKYLDGKGQYAYLNSETSRYLRLQDWAEGFALGVRMPYTLNNGKKYNVTVEQATGLPTSLTQPAFTQMRVVKKSEGKVWLQDNTSGIGFILMLAEEEDND